VAWLEEQFGAREGFFIATVELPAHLGPLDCGLYGPAVGDEPVPDALAVYAKRGTRDNASRMVRRPSRPTRTLTVIAGPQGPGNSTPDDTTIMYTSYGGPCAPREPGDLSLQGDGQEAALAESKAFWAEHALAITDGDANSEAAMVLRRLAKVYAEEQKAFELRMPCGRESVDEAWRQLCVLLGEERAKAAWLPIRDGGLAGLGGLADGLDEVGQLETGAGNRELHARD
jgi:hypothetical protein